MSTRFQIQLNPAADSGVSACFSAGPEQTVLQAALQAGVRLASSCRNGSCRACACRLLTGEIAYRIDWPGLSREEKAAGWMLPCVAEARSDLRLAPLEQTG